MRVTNKKSEKRKWPTIKRVTERWVLKRKQNLSTGFDVLK